MKVRVCPVVLILILAFNPAAFGNATDNLFALCLSPDASPEMIQAALNASADVNARDTSAAELTPLVYAVTSLENVKIIETLLAAGADVNARDNQSMTPLMHAAFANRNPGIVKTLLGAGAPVDEKDSTGRTALSFSVMGAGLMNPEIIRVLINAGADVNITDNYGTSILMEAARTMSVYESWDESIVRPEVFMMILDSGADIDAKTRTGLTALDFAESSSVTKALIDALTTYFITKDKVISHEP